MSRNNELAGTDVPLQGKLSELSAEKTVDRSVPRPGGRVQLGPQQQHPWWWNLPNGVNFHILQGSSQLPPAGLRKVVSLLLRLCFLSLKWSDQVRSGQTSFCWSEDPFCANVLWELKILLHPTQKWKESGTLWCHKGHRNLSWVCDCASQADMRFDLLIFAISKHVKGPRKSKFGQEAESKQRLMHVPVRTLRMFSLEQATLTVSWVKQNDLKRANYRNNFGLRRCTDDSLQCFTIIFSAKTWSSATPFIPFLLLRICSILFIIYWPIKQFTRTQMNIFSACVGLLNNLKADK